MTDTPRQSEVPDIPDAVIEPKRRRSLQLVWIIPIVAALIGASLAVKSFMERGPVITITFKSGEGWRRARPRSNTRMCRSDWSRGLPSPRTART